MLCLQKKRRSTSTGGTGIHSFRCLTQTKTNLSIPARSPWLLIHAPWLWDYLRFLHAQAALRSRYTFRVGGLQPQLAVVVRSYKDDYSVVCVAVETVYTASARMQYRGYVRVRGLETALQHKLPIVRYFPYLFTCSSGTVRLHASVVDASKP